CQHCYNTPWTF
nr:immunoglobulin light chain junction region [Macaca mulatta]MOY04134.1 immunoglobulin light chain junction region [Macaca mulatta]